MKKAIFTTLLFLAVIGASGQNPQRGRAGMPKAKTENITRKWLDIPYAHQSESQKLDIYLPEMGEGPFPVIVSVHGGAFKMGDKGDGQVNPMLHGLERGYAVVSVNYRLSGEAIFPANIMDVKAAIRWIKANAAQYHFDASKIAIWGGSAGGNLSALAGTSAGVSELEDLAMGNDSFDSRVQAVVDYFGPTNFLMMDRYFTKSGKGKADHSLADSPESLVIGTKITDVPELVAKADPTTYITRDDPPFLIVHGKEDQLVPTEMSIQLAEDLKKVLGEENVELKLIDGARHGGSEFESDEIIDIVFTFLDKHLKKIESNKCKK